MDASAETQPDTRRDAGPETRPEIGTDDTSRRPAPIEAPDRLGQSDQPTDQPAERPAAAAAQEPGTDSDDDDLPKRRGWWQRWV